MSIRLTILIAEDSPADRMLLSTIVNRLGHRVLTASNGLEALAMFEQERPHLVLMDALMPVMDGFEAARRVKALTGDELVPIIFLTSLSEQEALVRCLEAGGDDFVAKPYNQVILGAKINAMARLRQLQNTVLAQRDVIAQHNAHLLHEQAVAKAVFDRVAHAGCLNARSIEYLQSPLALFNGDLLLASYTPAGDMLVMLGDFTGHGLPAAIGAMPVAELFYGMSSKGHSLAEIARAINRKLKAVLPVGVFCCANMLCISTRRELLEIWSGGLPDGYLLGGAAPVALRSVHLPLGILEAEQFNDSLQAYPFTQGQRIALLTDGVLEAVNRKGEAFTEARLLPLLVDEAVQPSLCVRLEQALRQFCGAGQDDLSFIVISFDAQAPVIPVELAAPKLDLEQDYSVRFEWRAASLRRLNPVPQVMQILLEVDALRARAGALYTVLAELYTNALEHGVLGLNSQLKAAPEGFSRYYRERDRRLAQLTQGWVSIELVLSPDSDGGRLRLTVQDSGAGFAAEHLTQPENTALSGRGLQLVRELSDGISWFAGGSGVCVEFYWSARA